MIGFFPTTFLEEKKLFFSRWYTLISESDAKFWIELDICFMFINDKNMFDIKYHSFLGN